ncbi:MAG TPA: PAS domain-containing sensor histidine kinase [Candidatus Eisenbacteria bacterium]|nr:PAS domain-containing sensor histidine kinase [Candidatus Eisenbacteria bacterium]
MDCDAGKDTSNYTPVAACDLYELNWTTTTIPGLPEARSAALGPPRRTDVLAASDVLLADLILAMDLLDDAVIVLSEDGKILHWNQAAALVARPIKVQAIRSVHLLGPSEPWAACRQLLQDYQTKSGGLEREIHDPGSGKYWSLRLSELSYLGVFPRRLALQLRDVTEAVSRSLQLQEREVMAATGTLLAGAAHQTKNAIFGLSATLDAFEAHLDDRVAADNEYLHHLRAGITRMQLLMRDLLDYGNPTQANRTAVSTAAVVRHSASVCEDRARNMGLALAVDIADDAEVLANSGRLVRALENLLENALQHSPQGGIVTIRLARAGEANFLRLDVIDQGPGFPPEHIHKLFTPFFTLRPGGTGLGLTIAKQIVEDLGGAIQLSNGSSGGAQAAVFLPIHAENPSGLRNFLSEHGHAEM